MQDTIRDKTWGKILVGGFVWFFSFTAVGISFEHLFSAYFIFWTMIVIVSLSTILTLLATDGRASIISVIFGTGVWMVVYMLALSLVEIELPVSLPFERLDLLFDFPDFLMVGVWDFPMMIGFMGALFFFGGRALLENYRATR